MRSIHTALYRQGLTRSTTHRVIGGVCGGLADKFGVDPWAVRVIVVLSMMLIPGSQLLLYPIAWVLMPDDRYGVETGLAAGAATPSQQQMPPNRPAQQDSMITIDEGYRYDQHR